MTKGGFKDVNGGKMSTPPPPIVGAKRPTRARGESILSENKDFIPRPFCTMLMEEAAKGNTVVSNSSRPIIDFLMVTLINRTFVWNSDGVGKNVAILVPDPLDMDSVSKYVKLHVHIPIITITEDQHHHPIQPQVTQILVMSPDSFLQLLDTNTVSLSDFQMVFLFEAHLVLDMEHSYCNISRRYRETTSFKPQVIGFMKSFMESSDPIDFIRNQLDTIGHSFNFRVEAATEFRLFNKFNSNPVDVELMVTQVSLDETLMMSINPIVQDFAQFLSGNMHLFPPIVMSYCITALHGVMSSLRSSGPWGCHEFSHIFSDEVTEFLSLKGVIHLSNRMPMSSPENQTISILHLIKTFLDHISVTIETFFFEQDVDPMQQIMFFSSPKIITFLEVLRTIHTHDPKSKGNFCALIYANERGTVRVLFSLLELVMKYDPSSYCHLKPNLVLDRTYGRSMDPLMTMKQEETLCKFRRHDYNTIITCCVREEGLDVPRCNNVLLFDVPDLLADFTLLRGRARFESSRFLVLSYPPHPHPDVPANITPATLITPYQRFKQHEQLLCSYTLEPVIPHVMDIAPQVEQELVKRYTSEPMTLLNAVTIINRYCLKLPSDSFTKLAPRYELQEINSKWICTLSLPISCPLKGVVKGDPMPSPRLSKGSAAFATALQLRDIGELDQGFITIGKEGLKDSLIFLGINPHCDNYNPIENGPKSRRYYTKKMSKYLTHAVQPDVVDQLSEPEPQHHQRYLYAFGMKLMCQIPDEQNTRGRKITDPVETTKSFGFICPQLLPQICDFPIYTRSGEVQVSLHRVAQITLSNEQLDRIITFHHYLFRDVLHLEKFPMQFDPNHSRTNHFIVPIDFTMKWDTNRFIVTNEPMTIDWTFMDIVYQFELKEKEGSIEPSISDREKFKFDPNLWVDAVIRPWYRQNRISFFYVAEICDQMSPISPFPSPEHESFVTYYQDKYEIKIMNHHQPLLDVDITSGRLNLLTPRYVNRKGITLPTGFSKSRKDRRDNVQLKQILIPELCTIHPFSASLWKKAVAIPCILYRINSLLVAEEMRDRIARDIEVGLQSLKVTHLWPPLSFGWTLADVVSNREEMLSIMNAVSPPPPSPPPSHHHPQPKKPPSDSTDHHMNKRDNMKHRKKHHPPKQMINQLNITSSPPPPPPPPQLQPPLPPPPTTDDGDFVIDTFDPSKIDWANTPLLQMEKISPIDPDINLFGDIDFTTGGVINLGSSTPIGPSIGTWDTKPTAKVTSKQRYRKDIKSSMTPEPDSYSNGSYSPRMGSPSSVSSSIDFSKSPKGKPTWDEVVEGDSSDIDGNLNKKPGFLDLDTNAGLSQISFGAIDEFNLDLNLHGLMQDLTLFSAPLDPVVPSEGDDDDDNDDDGQFSDDDQMSMASGLSAKSGTSLQIVASSPLKVVPSASSEDLINDVLMNPICNREAPFSSSLFNHITEDMTHFIGRFRLPVGLDEIISSCRDVLVESEDETENETEKKVVSSPYVQSTFSVDVTKGITMSTITSDDPDQVTNDEPAGTKFGELLPKDQRMDSETDGYDSELGPYFDPTMGHNPQHGPSPAMILQALTMSNAGDGINLERMETVGDSFLKYSVTLYLFLQFPSIHEGKLSFLRSRVISNRNLFQLGRNKGLAHYMVGSKFEPNDNWLPPGFYLPIGFEEALIGSYGDGTEPSPPIVIDHDLDQSPEADEGSSHNIPYCLLTQQSLPDKSLADCVEALIGAYLLESGPSGAIKLMESFGIRVEFTSPSPQDIRMSPSSVDSYIGMGMATFERDILQYEFKNKSLLVEAMTHNSFCEGRDTNGYTDCYQRLEFLGDAILDFLVTRMLYHDKRTHSPGTLTDLRSALVNNTFFARLAVEYKFHHYLRNSSRQLHTSLQVFIQRVHSLPLSTLRSTPFGSTKVTTNSDPDATDRLHDVEVPKALGDIFESVAGAIFLDSNMDLHQVWTIYYRMMKPEIEHFSNHVPKAPIRELLEMEPQNAQFGKPELIPGKKIRVGVEVFGEGKFFGVGRNKKLAKSTAAKRALRFLRPKRSGGV